MSNYDYSIEGSDLQMVEVTLKPQQGLCAEAGSMIYMENGISMSTGTGGGLLSGFKRMLGGAGFFLTTFMNDGTTPAKIGFSAAYPGKVIPIELREHGGQLMAHKDSFLCASSDTKVEMAFTQKFSAGLFGGDGFILQKLTGNDLAFVHAGGALINKELKAGEVLRVDTGCLAAFESSVQYEVMFVKGVSNILFGGEGLFFIKLTGPGKIYLQSMPFAKLAHTIARTLPAGK